MNCTVRHEAYAAQAVHKVITSLHFKRYSPSGTLIHGQNLYAPRGKQHTSRHEAQCHEPVNKVKTLCMCSNPLIFLKHNS
jgi:hypothetical protein